MLSSAGFWSRNYRTWRRNRDQNAAGAHPGGGDQGAAVDRRRPHAPPDPSRAAEAGSVVVYVSHRYSTVRLADRIIVLDGGRVVEDGSHAELLAADGRYARLYRRQAAAYA